MITVLDVVKNELGAGNSETWERGNEKSWKIQKS